MINFGLIGTIFLFFFFSIGFNWLKSKKHYTPIYIGVCAQIPFFFFRSFYDATVKYIFEFSILLPLLILSISYVYRKYLTWNYLLLFLLYTLLKYIIVSVECIIIFLNENFCDCFSTKSYSKYRFSAPSFA